MSWRLPKPYGDMSSGHSELHPLPQNTQHHQRVESFAAASFQICIACPRKIPGKTGPVACACYGMPIADGYNWTLWHTVLWLHLLNNHNIQNMAYTGIMAMCFHVFLDPYPGRSWSMSQELPFVRLGGVKHLDFSNMWKRPNCRCFTGFHGPSKKL